MVKITNGKDVFEVTRGAFDNIYSHQGYHVLDSKVPASSNSDEDASNTDKTEDEKFVDDLLEKPISSWSKSEVKKFAEIAGVDISGTKNVNEAKDRIKVFINKNEENELDNKNESSD